MEDSFARGVAQEQFLCRLSLSQESMDPGDFINFEASIIVDNEFDLTRNTGNNMAKTGPKMYSRKRYKLMCVLSASRVLMLASRVNQWASTAGNVVDQNRQTLQVSVDGGQHW